MLKNQIRVGGLYKAKVSGNVVTVRVDLIRDEGDAFHGRHAYYSKMRYDVTNLATGRKTTFKSAAKFRSAVSLSEWTPLDGRGKACGVDCCDLTLATADEAERHEQEHHAKGPLMAFLAPAKVSADDLTAEGNLSN